jgi:FixJ family two-component response regulator
MDPTSLASVCVIEDDAAVRDSIRALLECERLGVHDFRSCEEFLATRAPWRVDCLILDVNLPSMNGLDFLEGLRARGFGGPVIVITGNADPATRRRTAAAGAALLEKPFEHRALVTLVRKKTGA